MLLQVTCRWLDIEESKLWSLMKEILLCMQLRIGFTSCWRDQTLPIQILKPTTQRILADSDS